MQLWPDKVLFSVIFFSTHCLSWSSVAWETSTSGVAQRSCQWLRIFHCWGSDSSNYQMVEQEGWIGESEWQAHQSQHSGFDDVSVQWTSAFQQFAPNCRVRGEKEKERESVWVCVCVCVHAHVSMQYPLNSYNVSIRNSSHTALTQYPWTLWIVERQSRRTHIKNESTLIWVCVRLLNK